MKKRINRASLNAIVLQHAAAMKRLSAIVRPAIRQRLRTELLRMGQGADKTLLLKLPCCLRLGGTTSATIRSLGSARAPQGGVSAPHGLRLSD